MVTNIPTGKDKSIKSVVKRVKKEYLDRLNSLGITLDDALKDYLNIGKVTKSNKYVTKDECKEIAREIAELEIEKAKRGY